MDNLYVTPLYTQSEAAGMIGTAQSTFNRWASGYVTAAGDKKPGFVTSHSKACRGQVGARVPARQRRVGVRYR